MDRTETLQIRLPLELVKALEAEALRRIGTPNGARASRSQVAADVLRAALPDFIAAELRRDLGPPLEVEARATERTANRNEKGRGSSPRPRQAGAP